MGANGWRFRTTRNETALLDFMNEEDREGFEPWEESDWVEGWEAALALYDEYPWAVFCPTGVHPDFAGRIWLAVHDRFGPDKQDEWPGYNLENWQRLCHGGGRFSAYSDFERSV